jgi:hypothetical protein
MACGDPCFYNGEVNFEQVLARIRQHLPNLQALHSKEGFKHRGHNYQEDTTSKPAAGDLAGVMLSVIPFFIDLDRPDKAHNGADGIHEVSAGSEIAFDLVGGFVNAGVAVLGKTYGGYT